MGRVLLLAILGVILGGCVDMDALAKSYAERDVVEKVGVLAHLDIAWPNSTAAFRRALAFFKAEGVAQVIVLGDPTRNGYANQREVYAAACREALRGAKTPQIVEAADPYTYAGIRFTGFGRLALTDQLCVQPLTGKTVNAGSMHGITISELFVKADPKTAARWDESAQGLLVLRRASGLTVRRLDFSERLPAEIGPAWEVDANGLIVTREGRAAPEFWPDTVVSAVRGYDAKGNPIYTLRWPPVLAKHTGERAFSYDVLLGDKVVCRLQSRGFHLPEDRDSESVACIIREDALEGRPPRFGITPVSALGQSGKTVWSR